MKISLGRTSSVRRHDPGGCGTILERSCQFVFIGEKLNGNLAMSWVPDLKGKELGIAMTNFRRSLGDTYNDFYYE